MLVFTRVMGLLLAALAVNLTVTGIINMRQNISNLFYTMKFFILDYNLNSYN